MRRRLKSKSLSGYCRNLINEYASNECDDAGFKEKLRVILDEFAEQNRLHINTAVSLCSWIIKRRYVEDYRLKVEKICDLVSEVDILLGEELRKCGFYARLKEDSKDETI